MDIAIIIKLWVSNIVFLAIPGDQRLSPLKNRFSKNIVGNLPFAIVT
jgi:hypothetical protein